MVIFLGPLLFLYLVPVMSAEVEPTEESIQVEFTLQHCQPGGIEGGELVDNSLCEFVPLEEGDVYMSASDPMDGDAEWLEPDNISDRRATWNVEARGEFVVYLIVSQDSIAQCEESRLTTSVQQQERRGHTCMEQAGQAWLVQPFVTSEIKTSWLLVYQEIEQ